MKAELKNYRQSPRKVRLVGNLIRGKSVDRALLDLKFLGKRAAHAFEKLVQSAIANAEHNFKIGSEKLVIKSLSVTKGPTLKRMMPASRGRAHRINKRTSIISLELTQK